MCKALVPVILFLLFSVGASAQSGRRKPPLASPTPTPEATPTPPSKPEAQRTLEVTAEKNQDYRCSDDGTLAHLMDDPATVKGYQMKEVDTRAEILDRPEPRYTEQARKVGVQGVVVLKVLLSPARTVDRIRVARRLPYGLTESAIRAACQIKFKPAIKGGEKVPQWATVEYGFTLTKSSIYGP